MHAQSNGSYESSDTAAAYFQGYHNPYSGYGSLSSETISVKTHFNMLCSIWLMTLWAQHSRARFTAPLVKMKLWSGTKLLFYCTLSCLTTETYVYVYDRRDMLAEMYSFVVFCLKEHNKDQIHPNSCYESVSWKITRKCLCGQKCFLYSKLAAMVRTDSEWASEWVKEGRERGSGWVRGGWRIAGLKVIWGVNAA